MQVSVPGATVGVGEGGGIGCEVSGDGVVRLSKELEVTW